MDNQAIDRVHRIGQVKNVEVHRVVVPNTVEERILAMHKKKQVSILGWEQRLYRASLG